MTVYNENSVPLLYRGPGERIGLSDKSHKAVRDAHAAAQKALETDPESYHADHLYTGEAVIVHNKAPVAGEREWTPFAVGGSTIDEALKEVIGAFDVSHVGEPGVSSDHIHTPDWVASTSDELATHLADYYSCKVIPISEVPY